MPADPFVQVSWGELIDKITILEIKSRALSSKSAIENVKRELKHLRQAFRNARSASPAKIDKLKRELKAVNQALWKIEDRLRAKEAKDSFDDEFVHLARQVYKNNDQRARLKRALNDLLKSNFVEEKQYHAY